MIAFALQAAAMRELASRRDDDGAADMPDLLRVFHPPGVIRLVSPAEEEALRRRIQTSGAGRMARSAARIEEEKMANFGARLAYPVPDHVLERQRQAMAVAARTLRGSRPSPLAAMATRLRALVARLYDRDSTSGATA